jgi:N-acetylglucosaminyldiphosphoundecaprenol N-acetyl-beta-D-mannosaminyltransferase
MTNYSKFSLDREKDFLRNVWCVLGLPFDAVDLPQCANEIIATATEKKRCFLSTPNLNFLCAAQTDEHFRQSVINSDLSIADGFPIVLIAKLLGIPLPERVAGSGLMEYLLNRKTDSPLKVYFFGGESGVGEQASLKINDANAGLYSVGYYCPGFGSVNEMSRPEIIEQINASNCDFLIVSLGAKKGQAWIEQNREHLNVPVISHLGAVINFFAGSVKRAPLHWQRLGLEWLWRIYQEPKLWKRYFDDGLCFLGMLFTNVFPYWFWLKKNKSHYNHLAGVTITEQKTMNETINVFLSGRCFYKDIEPLRELFSCLSSQSKNIIIDLTNVTIIDNAFLGLSLVLYQHLKANGNTLGFINANKTVLSLFKWNKVNYLLM